MLKRKIGMENPETEGREEVSSKKISAPANLETGLHNTYTVDCKFIVGEKLGVAKIIFGHKLVFSLNSEVFESMFSGHFLEAKCTEIPLPDDDPTTFRNLRHILYNLRDARAEIAELNVIDTISLFKLCDKYMFTNIKKICAGHLKTFLGIAGHDQLISLFEVAVEFPNQDLLDEIKKKLCLAQYPITEAVYNLNPITFMKYFEFKVEHNYDDFLPIFNAIEKYLTCNNLIPQQLLKSENTQQQPSSSKNFNGQENVVFLSEERLIEFLEKLLSFVNFSRISIKGFLSGPGASKILTLKQKYYILSQLCADPKPLSIKLYQN
ncbi:uncharacterized protein [Musca autumnalis]|uniref:uncharacterized protein n=1 Tax=Musca autumnalis TaxID=221902 RepID=UPI003CF06057